MANADGPLEDRAVEGLLKVDQFPDTAADFNTVILEDGEACRVIPAIVKPLQPVKEKWDSVLGAVIPDYPAHE